MSFWRDKGSGVISYESGIGGSHTGDTSITTLTTVTIPGGTLLSGDKITIESVERQSGDATASTSRWYINTTLVKFIDHGAANPAVMQSSKMFVINSTPAVIALGTAYVGESNGVTESNFAVTLANDFVIEFKTENGHNDTQYDLVNYSVKVERG